MINRDVSSRKGWSVSVNISAGTSAYDERVVDVMEELMKFTLLTHDVAPYRVDCYSERRDSAADLAKRVNPRAI